MMGNDPQRHMSLLYFNIFILRFFLFRFQKIMIGIGKSIPEFRVRLILLLDFLFESRHNIVFPQT